MTAHSSIRYGVPWIFIALLLGVAVLLGGCGTPVSVVSGETRVQPPAALMEPPEELVPILWGSDGKLLPGSGASATPSTPLPPVAKSATTSAPISIPPSSPSSGSSKPEAGMAPIPTGGPPK